MKRAPLKRRRKAFTRDQREASEAWHRGIRGKRCAVCGARAEDAHHIIRLQVLRRHAVERGFDIERVRWDKRNRLPLCRACHGNHHNRSRPIPRRILRGCAPKVFQLAAELGLEFVIEREYPDEHA